MRNTRTVLYVAADEKAAREGSSRLEGAAPALETEPVVGLEELRDRAPTADCVVFAETPTTVEGANLLEVIDAAGAAPVVLFTDAEYGPTAARSTDGIDGYVRRGPDGAFAHLADEVAWCCHDPDGPDALPEGSVESDDVLAALPEGVFAVDAAGRIAFANEWLGEALGVDATGLRGVPLESLASSGTLSAADAAAIDDAIDEVLEGEVRVAELSATISTGDGAREVALRIAAGGEDAVVCVRPTDEESTAADDSTAESAADESDGSDDARLRELAAAAAEITAASEDAADETDATADVADRAVAAVRNVLEADEVRLRLADDGELVPVAHAPESAGSRPEGLQVDASSDGPERDACAAEAYRSGEVVLESESAAGFPEYESALAAPVGDRGILRALAGAADAFDESDRGALELLGVLVDGMLERVGTEAALERTDARLSSAFDAIPEPAVRYEVVDGTVLVREVNPAFATAAGVVRDAVRGEPLADYVRAPDGGEGRTRSDVLTTDKRVRLTARRRIGGDDRDVRLTVRPLEFDRDGDVVAGLVVYADRTERNRLERKLEARTDRLEAVAGIVDEEVREPMNVARGYLELAEATGDAEHFAEVDDAHERIGGLLDRLCSLARGEDADSEPETEELSLRRTARRAWRAVDTGSAAFELADNAALRADPDQLATLLETLLETVAASGSADGDSITVRVGATETGFAVVADGRDAALMAAFGTAADDPAGGLGAVERIASAHGWTLEIDESANGGARVVVDGARLEAEERENDGSF